jgi:hypothetical protein
MIRQRAVTMKKTLLISTTLLLCSCFSARIDVIRHPDYNFGPTNPNNLALYNGFLPTKAFIIIGQITITETYLTNLGKSAKEILNAVASIGGNALIISDSQIQWMKYNTAVKSGSASIRDYGYEYRANWQETTRYTQTDVPVARYIYGYIIRWQDYVAKDYIDPARYYSPGQKTRAKIKAVFRAEEEDKIILDPEMKLIGKIPESIVPVPGMQIEIYNDNDNYVHLYFLRNGISYEAPFRKIK